MRRLRPRGLLYVALGCAILATQTLKADTILINDLPGLFTFSVTDPVREQASIEAPGFANVTIFNPPGATLIAGGGLFEILVMEPVGTGCSPFSCASDFIIGDESDLPSGDTIVDITFTVEDESFFADCSSEPCIQENGDVQNFAALYWSDGTIDTIDFKSTEPAPEPSTLLLLCTGILGVGALTVSQRLTFARRQE